ncbi:MAG TPA: response regulator [Nitrososphaeraceae archaeon]|nr:response regulator [Nitrososphaeraceae archaeon]
MIRDENTNTRSEQHVSMVKETPKSNESPYRILFVDDDHDILFSIQKNLELHGFVIDTFSNPLEALASFNPEAYHLILIDVKMPEMSGFEFYKELQKKITHGTEIKICFITAFEIYFETLKSEFPELYSGCFIKKPINTEDLLKKIKEELEMS